MGERKGRNQEPSRIAEAEKKRKEIDAGVGRKSALANLHEGAARREGVGWDRNGYAWGEGKARKESKHGSHLARRGQSNT